MESAEAKRHERETGNNAALFQRRNSHREFLLDLRRDGASINDVGVVVGLHGGWQRG